LNRLVTVEIPVMGRGVFDPTAASTVGLPDQAAGVAQYSVLPNVNFVLDPDPWHLRIVFRYPRSFHFSESARAARAASESAPGASGHERSQCLITSSIRSYAIWN
jgi:hypothetical protein